MKTQGRYLLRVPSTPKIETALLMDNIEKYNLSKRGKNVDAEKTPPQKNTNT